MCWTLEKYIKNWLTQCPLLFKNLSRIKRFPYELECSSNLKATHKKCKLGGNIIKSV